MFGTRNGLVVAVICLALLGCGKDKANGGDGGQEGGLPQVSNASGSAEKSEDGFCTPELAKGVKDLGAKMTSLGEEAQSLHNRGDDEAGKAKLQEAVSACNNFTGRFQAGFECTVKENNQVFRMDPLKASCAGLQKSVDSL